MKSFPLSRRPEIRPLFDQAMDQPLLERDDWIDATTPVATSAICAPSSPV